MITLFALSLLLVAMTSFPKSAAASVELPSPWRQLASIPDRVGFAGMFAGVLDGKLVVGGGSQFREKPLWLNGEKSYSDRIFILEKLDGEWSKSAVTLPRGSAHFASAADGKAIYVVGGADRDGSVSEVHEIRMDNGQLRIRPLTHVPEKLVYAAAAVAHGRLYVAGGQNSLSERKASAKVWSLAIGEEAPVAQWRSEPDLPDGGIFVGAMAEAGGAVYFVGGVGFSADGKSVQSKRIYRLDSANVGWERLSDMPEPRVGPLSPCPIVGNRLFVMGGYATAFTGERRDHPGFSRQTYLYDIAAQQWRDGPVIPHVPPQNKDATGDKGPAPMVAAPGVVWRDHVIAVSGEVRASVRTPAVLALPLAGL